MIIGPVSLCGVLFFTVRIKVMVKCVILKRDSPNLGAPYAWCQGALRMATLL